MSNYTPEQRAKAIILEMKCKEEIQRLREECAVATGLTLEQVEELQKRGFGISEIMAGKPEGKYFIPKTLIRVVPNFSIFA